MFRHNEEAIAAQIRSDARTNDDGSAVILMGKYNTDVTLLRTLNAEAIINLMISDDTWERAWIHNRMATTQFKGLPGAHGFDARYGGNDWYVMHNGRFVHQEANKFRVDSEWAADLVRKYGPLSSLKVIAENEHFANMFLICPTEGRWFVLRQTSGSLNTDGQGNYSTHKITGLIEDDVKSGTQEEFKFDVTTKPFISRYNISHGYVPPVLPEAEKKTGSSTTKGMESTTNRLNRVDTKGQVWERSRETGLWLRQEGETLYVRRIVNGEK